MRFLRYPASWFHANLEENKFGPLLVGEPNFQIHGVVITFYLGG